MSLLFLDGFDHYSTTAQILSKWTALTGVPVIQVNQGRYGAGTNSVYCSGFASIQKTLSGTFNTFIVGLAVKPMGNTNVRLVSLLDANGALQATLRLMTDMTIQMETNQSSGFGNALSPMPGGRTAMSLTQDGWYYLEWKVQISDSNTVASVIRIGEVVACTSGTGYRTMSQLSAIAGANILQIGDPLSYTNASFDDVVVMNTLGTVNNTFEGDCRIECLYPSAAGTNSSFTPVGATPNFACVNEHPPDAETTYVVSGNPGDRDSYIFTDLSSEPESIKAIQTNLFARKDDAGGRVVAPLFVIGGVEYTGTNLAVYDNYLFLQEIQETSPATGLAWTEAEVNGMEIGAKVIS